MALGTHWKINDAELERLREMFKLKYPVHVQGSAAKAKNKYGSYHGLSRITVRGRLMDYEAHQVSLACDVPVTRLIETVIHECVHAVQRERKMAGKPEVPNKKFHKCDEKTPAYLIKKDGRAAAEKYWNDPIEIEARAVAKVYAPLFPDLLEVKRPRTYTVTNRYNGQVYRGILGRSPSSACQRVAKAVYGRAADHVDFTAVLDK